MLLGTILLASLIIGLLGIFIIILSKVIVVKLLGAQENVSITALLGKSKKLFPYQQLSSEKVLKKLLMRIKIIFLKGENTIDAWLDKVSSSKKFSDDYWKKIKKREK